MNCNKQSWTKNAQLLVAVTSLTILAIFIIKSVSIIKSVGNVNEPSDIQQYEQFVSQMHEEATQHVAKGVNVVYVNLDTNTYVYEVPEKPLFRESQGARKISTLPRIWEVNNNDQFFLVGVKQSDRHWRIVMRLGDRSYSLTEAVQEFGDLLNR